PLDRLPGLDQVEAVVSNPPYIPTPEIANLPREIREHEPMVALDGGPDGLAVHREIIAAAASHLVRGGMLALEVAARWDRAAAGAGLIEATGQFGPPRIIRDYAGMERVVVATRAADRAVDSDGIGSEAPRPDAFGWGSDGHHRH